MRLLERSSFASKGLHCIVTGALSRTSCADFCLCKLGPSQAAGYESAPSQATAPVLQPQMELVGLQTPSFLVYMDGHLATIFSGWASSGLASQSYSHALTAAHAALPLSDDAATLSSDKGSAACAFDPACVWTSYQTSGCCMLQGLAGRGMWTGRSALEGWRALSSAPSSPLPPTLCAPRCGPTTQRECPALSPAAPVARLLT